MAADTHGVPSWTGCADLADQTDQATADDGPMVQYTERAEFYEVEYQTTVDQPFLRRLVTDQVRSILEIPCGSGRNLGWLHETGREVVCADLEAAMVRRVRERIAALGAQARISTVTADLRWFDLGRRFDLVLVPQEAFQLLCQAADAQAALHRLAAHVAPGGRLLLDLHRFAGQDKPDVLPDYFDPAVPEGMLVAEWTRPVENGRQLTRARRQHDHGETVQIVYHYRLHGDEGMAGQGDAGLASQWASKIVLRRYQLADIQDLATQAGLTIQSVARDYAGRPYQPGAGRMITILSPAGGDEKGKKGAGL
ncbi:MAG TPA: class I SAM-dependent methyltransferase [Pseudonocardiaceae bacterium]|nr:class I SAM-dependent methyltransferase [Pseudonocardiaceae bacterium]